MHVFYFCFYYVCTAFYSELLYFCTIGTLYRHYIGIIYVTMFIQGFAIIQPSLHAIFICLFGCIAGYIHSFRCSYVYFLCFALLILLHRCTHYHIHLLVFLAFLLGPLSMYFTLYCYCTQFVHCYFLLCCHIGIVAVLLLVYYYFYCVAVLLSRHHISTVLLPYLLLLLLLHCSSYWLLFIVIMVVLYILCFL